MTLFGTLRHNFLFFLLLFWGVFGHFLTFFLHVFGKQFLGVGGSLVLEVNQKWIRYSYSGLPLKP